MEKTFKSRIKHKLDTSANWTSKNPILLDGEIILVETDNGIRLKIGNGTSRYNSLPFFDEALISLISANFVTKEELQQSLSALNLGFSNGESDM